MLLICLAFKNHSDLYVSELLKNKEVIRKVSIFQSYASHCSSHHELQELVYVRGGSNLTLELLNFPSV